MISLEDVGMAYPQTDRLVLSGLTMHVPAGEFLCILGQSGCGKTTILNLIAGFLRPTSGRILVNGCPVRGPGPDRAMIFQDAPLFPWLTVAGNVAFGLRLRGARKPERNRIVGEQLERMGLADFARVYPCRLSGGMRQRIALARGLVLDPPVLLMDEPFSALDIPTRERLQDDLLALWAARETTIVSVTHSVDEAAYLARRIVVLSTDGSIVHEERTEPAPPRKRLNDAILDREARLRRVLRLHARPHCPQPIL